MNVFKYLFNWKYRYWYRKLVGVKCVIEDQNFKRYKTGEVREEIRQTYDTTKSKKAVLEENIKAESEPGGLKEKNIDEFKRLEDQVVLMDRDLKRYEDQMKGIDMDIAGSKPTNEYPQGVTGIEQTIDSLHELQDMMKDWMKNHI